jgi:hypothetical protein
MIIVEKCLEIGLPEPHRKEEPLHFVKRVLAENYNLNSRLCRYIGIPNLPSIVLKLYRLGIAFEGVNSPVYCPLLKLTLPDPVIGIYMTQDQQQEYWRAKTKPITEVTQ